ncbi:MAG: excinuclease ABC subunit A, partial [Planctomycetaceae bacterium]|nr:excinuclease ABC subunit A [Planctomycetaceae bacterium]
MSRLTVAEGLHFFENLSPSVAPNTESGPPSPRDEARQKVWNRTVPEIQQRLRFLMKVGLDYPTLNRSASSLSGGEFQRARLASCLGTGLRGVCYVLDEPTAGLHPLDTRRLIDTLTELRDQGNSVLVVEHDVECMQQADWLVDLGPGAGLAGGYVVASGPPNEVANHPNSVTAPYLKRTTYDVEKKIDSEHDDPQSDRNEETDLGVLTLSGARRHNLKDVTLRLPLGRFTCVTGVSGSGKSTLISQTLVPAVRRALQGEHTKSKDFDTLQGWEAVQAVVEIDQSPLGRSAQSTPATFSGIWDEIRKLFAKTRASRIRGFKASRFSFNSRSGRCAECKGRGTQRVEMHFLPDVEMECPVCRGARFNRQTLHVTFRDKSVADVLAMTVSEALEVFENFAKLQAILAT